MEDPMKHAILRVLAVTAVFLMATSASAFEEGCDEEACTFEFCWEWGGGVTCEELEEGTGDLGCRKDEPECADCDFVIEMCYEDCDDGCNPQTGNCLGGECVAKPKP
jgi:hypothetical protein